MQSHNFNRKALPIRLIAALVLAFMLPASVLAAPMRYCVGQNGHRGIEFVLAKHCSHENADVKSSAGLIDFSIGALHVVGSHCQDRLLVPEVTKPDACRIATSHPEPVLPPGFRAQKPAPTKPSSQAARRFAPGFWYLDLRLVCLRTIVLLN